MAAPLDFASTIARLRPALDKVRSRTALRVLVEVLEGDTIVGKRDLEPGIYRLGARPDCDLVLPELREAHVATLKLEADEKNVWSISLIPFIDGLELNGEPLTAFNPASITGPAVLRANGASVRISPVGGFSTQKTALSLPKNLPLPATNTVLMISGLLFLAALFSSFSDVLMGQPATPIVQKISDDGMISNPADIVTYLRRQLASADLADRVQVSNTGKSILLEGTIGDRQEERLRSILAGARKRTTTEIRTNIRPLSLPVATQISGIALAPIAFVVMRNGERYKIGDVLQDEWKIEQISTKGVVVARNGLTELITLGGK